MSLKSAYRAGLRAGRSEPNTEVVNGLTYVKNPRCPFGWRQPFSFFMWHEGLYRGFMQRLASKGAI